MSKLMDWISLRVLLIRKDFKPKDEFGDTWVSLRVLLIRKDFKQKAMRELNM